MNSPRHLKLHNNSIPIKIFVSYAQKNIRQLERLDAMLDLFEQQHGVLPWQDKRLIAGIEWDIEIRQRLEEADVFLFIASQASLVSKYIRNVELSMAEERYKKGQIEIVTIKLEPCACDEHPFLGKFQRLGVKHKSIAEATLKSAAWNQVRIDLLPVIEKVREKKKGLIRL
jgi:hypothetical protein